MSDRPHPEFPHYYPEPELVSLEQGERAALYARWPSLFTVALRGLRYPESVNRMLSDLSWATNHAAGVVATGDNHDD